MTFHASETSQESGRPVYLLKFVRQGKTWFYTNAEFDISFNSDLYLSAGIVIPDIVQTGTATDGDGDVRITLPRSTTVAQYMDQMATSAEMSLFIRKAHMVEDPADGSYDAPGSADDAPVVWIGNVVGVGRPNPLIREFACAQLNLGRGGLRLSWGRSCPLMLYSEGVGRCNVDKTAFAVPMAEIFIVNGVAVSAPEAGEQEAGYFTGGFIEWESEPGVTERRGIELHSGEVMTIMGTVDGMDGATNIVVYPGCNRTPTHCHERFDNMLNYGGINHLQGKSPFDGDPVFY
jgi:hypothetical protein